MRRLLSDLGAYAGGLVRDARSGWDHFFFAPADPTPLGLIRLAVGLLLLWSLGVTGLDLRAFLGSDGWADPAVVRLFLSERAPSAWSLWFWVPDAWLVPAWAACLAVVGLFAAGFGSRVTAVLAWAIAVSTTRRSPVTVFGFDDILATWAFYLAVTGASGRAVSVDRLITRYRLSRAVARRRPGAKGRIAWDEAGTGAPAASVGVNLGLRLIQLHLCLVYLMPGLSKLQGSAWWDGTAAWGIVAAGEFRRFDLTWLAEEPYWTYVVALATHAALAFELSYPVAVWVRPLRPLALAAASATHLAIGLTLGLTEFSLAMLAGNLAFASGPWLRSLVAGRPPAPTARVLYDGGCPRCRASMAVVTAVDPDRVFEPVDLTVTDLPAIHPALDREACMRSMHVVDARGRVSVGYDAVLTLAWRAPLLWPFAIAGSVPGVPILGRRIYDRIARSRPRDEACTDDTCGLHPPTQPRAEAGRTAR